MTWDESNTNTVTGTEIGLRCQIISEQGRHQIISHILSVNYIPSLLALYARSPSEFDHLLLLIVSSQSPSEYNISISESLRRARHESFISSSHESLILKCRNMPSETHLCFPEHKICFDKNNPFGIKIIVGRIFVTTYGPGKNLNCPRPSTDYL